MKIQYPGVARSIESDVDNLLRIISLANILPKGLYIENAAKVRAYQGVSRLHVRGTHFAGRVVPDSASNIFSLSYQGRQAPAVFHTHIWCGGRKEIYLKAFAIPNLGVFRNDQDTTQI